MAYFLEGMRHLETKYYFLGFHMLDGCPHSSRNSHDLRETTLTLDEDRVGRRKKEKCPDSSKLWKEMAMTWHELLPSALRSTWTCVHASMLYRGFLLILLFYSQEIFNHLPIFAHHLFHSWFHTSPQLWQMAHVGESESQRDDIPCLPVSSLFAVVLCLPWELV